MWQDGSIGSSLTASTSGTYDVTITDANGCIASDTINVNVLSPLSIIKDSTAVTCYGLSDGTASATVSGGLPPYSYLWVDNGQTYNTPNATNLPAGTYSFVITDSNGCSLTDSVIISEPLPLTASAPGPDSIADFNFLGEYNGQFIYFHPGLMSWNNARQKALNNGGDLIVIKSQSDQLFYENLITNESWIGLFQNTNSPNYSYPKGGWEWIDGSVLFWDNTTNTYLSFENWGPQVQQVHLGISLMEIQARYFNWSSSGLWDDAYSTSGFPFLMSININSTTCNSGNDGQTYVTVSGGTSPYSYVWDNGQTTDTAYNLSAGNYVVTVTDDNGCTTTDTATITEPAVISGTDTQITCDSLTWIDGITYTSVTIPLPIF